jgi:hypothetical protein
LAEEDFSVLVRFLTDEATSSGTDSDYIEETTASLPAEEGTQT